MCLNAPVPCWSVMSLVFEYGVRCMRLVRFPSYFDGFDEGDVRGLQFRRRYQRTGCVLCRGSTLFRLVREVVESKTAILPMKKEFLLVFVAGLEAFQVKRPMLWYALLFIVSWIAKSYDPSWLSSQTVYFWDLGYRWCCNTAEGWYADRLVKSILNCSNFSRCSDCIFVLFALED